MEKVGFFTAVDYGQHPKSAAQFLLEANDAYFYLGGRKVQVVPEEIKKISQGVKWVKQSSSTLRTSI